MNTEHQCVRCANSESLTAALDDEITRMGYDR